MQLTIAPQTPGVFIKITDALSGRQIVGRVADSGTEFFDTPEQVLMPIFAEMQPIEIGDWNTLKFRMMDELPDHSPAFNQCITELIEQLPGEDDLGLMRAALHAFETLEFDASAALKVARLAADAAHERAAYITKAAEAAEAI